MCRRQECVVRARMTALLATSMNSEKDTFCKEDRCFGWLKKIPLSQRTVGGGLSTWELLFWNSVISSEFLLLPYTNGLSFYAAAPLVEQTEAFQAALVAKLKTGHRQAVCSFSFVTQMPWKVSVKRRKERHQRICSIFGNMCHYPKGLRPDRATGTSSRQVFQTSLGQTVRFLWAGVDSCSS